VDVIFSALNCQGRATAGTGPATNTTSQDFMSHYFIPLDCQDQFYSMFFFIYFASGYIFPALKTAFNATANPELALTPRQ
jgi:hypothetical protein